jgi:hypothetical protein
MYNEFEDFPKNDRFPDFKGNVRVFDYLLKNLRTRFSVRAVKKKYGIDN